MALTNDRTKETTTTTGTGALTLGGAVSTFQSFNAAFGSSSVTVQYCIVALDGSGWETGEGVFNGSNQLTRVKVRNSSNSDALVSFGSGTKEVFATVLAANVKSAKLGTALALTYGWGMY